MIRQPTLLEYVRSLDMFERDHIAAIVIDGVTGQGYKVRCSLALYRTMDPYDPSEPFSTQPQGGVKCEGAGQAPDLEAVLTWQIPVWDQVVELVKSPEAVCWLGTMHADECSRVMDGKVSAVDAGRSWWIATHGRARSAERNAWYTRIRHDPWLVRSAVPILG